MNKITQTLLAFLLIGSCSYASDAKEERDPSSSSNNFKIAEADLPDLENLTLNLKLNTNIVISNNNNDTVKSRHFEIPEANYHPQKNLYYREFESREDAQIFNQSLCQEKIIGVKDRREALEQKVHEAPWNCHFYLEIIYNNVNGKCRTYYGSSTLIHSNLLLTAAHNLYDEKDGGYPDQIDCFAACYNNDVLAETTIFPKKNPDSVFVPEAYIDSHGKDRPSDIALIIFSKENLKAIPKGLTIAIPILRTDTFPFDKVPSFYVTGYPGKRVAYTMGGKILNKEKDNTVRYDIDTERGQSGSGVWFQHKDKSIYCIGTHAYAGSNGEDFNIGILFNDEVVNAINKYALKD